MCIHRLMEYLKSSGVPVGWCSTRNRNDESNDGDGQGESEWKEIIHEEEGGVKKEKRRSGGF